MLIAVEAFLEHAAIDDDWDSSTLLLDFGRFVRGLGTQPVTVTTSSIVHDMVSCYNNLMDEGKTTPFLWHNCVAEGVYQFLLTRDCFTYHPDPLPCVEATFHARTRSQRTLDVEIFYSLALPRLHFVDLCNVVSENEKMIIQPDTSQMWCGQTNPAVETTYFIGPAEDWLLWDDDNERFEGVVPPHLAAHAGSERQDTYTIPLELTATLVTDFGCEIKFERIIRLALPLTVRRRPDRYLWELDYTRIVGKDEMSVPVEEIRLVCNG